MLPNVSQIPLSGSQTPALCVDLDGTLLATDMLWESILLVVKSKPHLLFAFPFWLVQGKAYLKRKIAERVKIDAASLPYREEVLSFLTKQREIGRTIILATASDRELVEPIVRHLALFDDVVASDGLVNLKGARKQSILQSRFGYRQFDYIGNSAADLPVWRSANAALLVEPSRSTLKKARHISSVQHIFSHRTSHAREVLNALRCHQWLKNLLLFVPLITSHKLFDGDSFLRAFLGFAAMSCCASSVYILNDLLDLGSDRRHPKKRLRPFAAGTLSISTGLLLSAVMCASGFIAALTVLPFQFTAGLAIYVAVTIAYSLLLKTKVVADVMTLALLYTLRILIGGAAVSVAISSWLLAFSMFLFLSLAFVKRYGEVHVLQKMTQDGIPGRGYMREDKEWMKSMGGTSGYLAILVLALYINSQEVAALYRHPEVLWFACPPLLYWISRIWLLACRGKIDDDPLVFAMTDRVSFAVGILVGIAIVAAL